jgi:hypothetical protein
MTVSAKYQRGFRNSFTDNAYMGTKENHSRSPMIVINAIRDFASGLGRGLSLYFSQRNDLTERALMPGRLTPGTSRRRR